MKKFALSLSSQGNIFAAIGILSLVLVLIGAIPAAAQDPQKQSSEIRQQAVQKKPQHFYRLSILRDRKVKNTKGEELGRISEVVIDKSGQVRYAVLSHGGTLGMNEKMTAIPWEALQISERGKYYTLDLSEEQLADAPTFDDDNWPVQPTWDISPNIPTRTAPQTETQR